MQSQSEHPIEIPLLLPDADLSQAILRHRARLLEAGVDLKLPKRRSALGGIAMMGLLCDQQEALIAALCSRYAQRYYGDHLSDLRRRFPPLAPIFDGAQAQVTAMRRRYLDVTGRFEPDDPTAATLQNLYRAWELKQRVVIEGRPMSLVSPVSLDVDGDAVSFTPVIRRLDENTWQLGEAGDAAPVSPRRFQADDLETLLGEMLATYAVWREKDGGWWLKQHNAADRQTDHFCLPVWERWLRRDGRLRFGERLTIENVSHGNILRLVFAGGRRVLVKSYPAKIVRTGIAVTGVTPPMPPVDEIEAAYLNGAALERVQPATQNINPLTGELLDAYRSRGVTVAWLKHPQALAVVSGAGASLRGCLFKNQSGDRLGVAPFSFKTRRPDPADMWATTPPAGAKLEGGVARRAMSAWLIGLWLAGSKMANYQRGKRKGR